MNLTEVLQELGVPYWEAGGHHHVTTGWIGIDCPWCSPGTGKARLGINLGTLHASCWVCGWRPAREALTLASGDGKGVALLLQEVPKTAFRKERVKGTLRLPPGLMPLCKQHDDYLKGRGLRPRRVERLWRLKGTANCPQPYAWRVYLPVIHRGEEVSWTMRSIGRHPLRYVSARPGEEAVPAKELLFGGDFCRGSVVAVEGPMDALRVGPGAAALLGLSYSRAQLALLAGFPVRAVCFDSSVDAQRRARRLCDDLASLPGQTHLVTLDADDPGSASDEEIRALRRAFLE